MQKHSGTIGVESTVGRGTEFKLTFPTNSKEDGMKVLIVDDEEGIRILHSRYIKRILPQASILYATNGQEAIDAAVKYRPQAIVADYSMPVMNGFDMLVQLKKVPETKNIPVLIITGEDSMASFEAMRLSGASEIFSKPVLPEQLGGGLKKALSGFLAAP
jgi:CheY-like chemotaxis protein